MSFTWQFSFYQFLDHFVILTRCKCLNYIDSDKSVYSWTMYLREFLLRIFGVSIFLKSLMSSNVNFTFFLLFFTIEHLLLWMNSFLMIMSTVRVAWSDGKQNSGKMLWLLSSAKLNHKKNKLVTKFMLLLLSEYWVGTC